MSRKEEMVVELNYLCSRDSKISPKSTREILKLISWKWTENLDVDGVFSEEVGNGYYGCTYWSQKALEAVYEDLTDFKRRKEITSNTTLRKTVTHEHVIPKSLFVNHVMEFVEKKIPITFEKEKVDNTMLVGCIVTKAEAKILDSKELGVQRKMPSGISFPVDSGKVWARYQLANEWCEANQQDKIIVNKVTWKMEGKKLSISKVENINI